MRPRRLAFRALGAFAALLLLAGLSVESGMARGFLRARLLEAFARAGLRARLESVDVSVLRRTATLRGLSVGGSDYELKLRQARLRLPWSALLAAPAFDEIEIEGLEIEVRRTARPAAARSIAVPAGLRLGRLIVRDAQLRLRDDARPLEVLASGLSLDASATDAGWRGTLRPGGTLRARGAQHAFEAPLSESAFALERGDLTFGPLSLVAEQGKLGISGAVRDLARRQRLELHIVAEADLEKAMGEAAPFRGGLRLDARLTGTPSSPVVQGTLRSPRLVSGTWSFEDVELRGTLAAAALDVASASARLADGVLSGRGRVALGDGRSEAHLEWQNLDLGSLLESGRPGSTRTLRPASRLSGRLEAAWPEARWREAQASGRIEAHGAPSAALAADGAALIALNGGVWTVQLETLRAADVAIRGELKGRLAERTAASTLTGTLALTADALDRSWGALATPGASALSGAARATLDIGGTLESPRARFALTGDRLVARDLALEAMQLRARGALTASRLEIASLAIESGAARIDGVGDVDLSSGALSGRVSASIADLAWLRALVPPTLDPSGALEATATMAGTWRAPTARVELRSGPIRLAGQGFASAEGRLATSETGVTIERLALVPATGGRIHVSGRVAAGASRTAELRIQADDADLAEAVRARASQAGELTRAVLSLDATLRGPLGEPERLDADVQLRRLELATRSRELRLEGPARLTKEEAAVAVEGLRLRSGATTLEAGGRLAAGTTNAIHARLEGRLEDFAALAPPLSRLSTLAGPIGASLAWSGDPRSPQLAARVEAPAVTFAGPGGDVGAMVTADLEAGAPSPASVRGAIQVERIRLDVEGATLEQVGAGRIAIDAGSLAFSGFEWHGAGSDLRLTGDVRLGEGNLALERAALGLDVEGQLDLRLLGALGAGLEGGGAAGLDLRLTGIAASPDVRGSITLRGAQVRYRPKRLSLDDLSGRLVLAEGRLSLEGVSGSVNGGGFEAKGAVALEGLLPKNGRIELSGRGATLDWPRGFLAELDASLILETRNGETTLAGDVTLASSSYKGNPRVLYLELEEWRARPSQPSALDPLRLDLRVRTLRELHADTIYGRLDLSADLAVTGRFDAPELRGRIQSAPGAQLFLGGRSYDVDSLTLDYTKAGGLLPFLRARATTRAQPNVIAYSVTADLIGPLDAPEARLQSEPPLTEREIASLLTTGRTAASGRSTDAVSLVAADFLGGLGRSFGLDTVRLEGGGRDELLSTDPTAIASEADPESRLTLTKRLGSSLEVTLSQALSQGGKRTTLISYKPLRGLEARAAQRDDQTYSFELRHDLSFGRATARAPQRREAARKEARLPIGEVRLRVDGGLSDQELRPRLKLAAGKRFDYHRWLEDRDRLQEAMARAGFFEARVFATREPGADRDLAPDTKLRLSYDVRSGPKTTLAFLGYAAPAGLRRQIERSWWLSEYSSSIEDEAVRITRAYLVDQGYVKAQAEARTQEAREAAPKTLVVRTRTGPRASQREIVFLGQKLLPEARLRMLVGHKDARRDAFRDPAALADAAVRLCRSEGLLAAKAEAAVSLRGDQALLEVRIQEGPPFAIAAVTVSGSVAVSAGEVREAARLETGAPYRDAAIDAARERVRRLLRSRGFVDAGVKVDGRIEPAQARVDVDVKVSQGPRQIIQELVVDGDVSPLAKRLEEQAGLKPGQPVVVEEWAEIRKRLYQTGLLRRVELQAEPIGDAAAEAQPVRARLSLEAWPSLRFRYGLQLAGTRQPLQEEGQQRFRPGGVAELTRQTLFGRAITTGAAAQARQGFANGRAFATLPWLLGLPLRSSVFATLERDDAELSLLGIPFVIRTDSTELTFEERFKPKGALELAAAYSVERARFRSDVPLFGPLDQRLRVARVVGTALVDGRDNVIDPLRGYFHSTSFEHGSPRLGSEFSFDRIFVQQYVYVPAIGRSLLALGARIERASGAVQALQTSNRLAAGGANTVRGYPDDVALGGAAALAENAESGSTLLVLNQELRFPLAGSLFGGAFFDHASRWLGGAGRVLSRSSLGIGLRYRTSVGVLRLDFGYPLEGEGKKVRFYFALGQAF